MRGDFSIDRFNRSKHFNRVLKQQGRVDLDSDWNEQVAIAQHYLRTLMVDLIGRAGGPLNNCGFGLVDAATAGLKPVPGDFILGAGRYYVDGLLVENEHDGYYSAQADLPVPDKLAVDKTYLAYLDVWERHITYLEDDWIREVALEGPDTATRVKTMWQVKVLESTNTAGDTPAPPPLTPEEQTKLSLELENADADLAAATKELETTTGNAKIATVKKRIAALDKRIQELRTLLADPVTPAPTAPDVTQCEALLKPLIDWQSGTMTARLEPADPADTPCILPPDSRFRGLENHLYRIEVHASGDTADPNHVPTFKWSRENGSVATRWLGTTGNDVRVAIAREFAAGQWVEFTTETDDLLGQPGPLTQITRVDGDELTVEHAPAFDKTASLPKVRRWDQAANDEVTLVDGAIAITPGTGEAGWIELEDGIEVQFAEGGYRSGDYWLISARVATGTIDWPTDSGGNELALPPRGVAHHYAALFLLNGIAKDPFVALVDDCRCRFATLPCFVEPKT